MQAADVPTLTSSLPRGVHHRLVLAEAQERTGDAAAAVETYQQVLREDPGCAAAWNNLGNIFASLNDWKTATVFLREADRLAPCSAATKNNLGNVLGQGGDVAGSLAAYRTAVALEPGSARFRNNLGNAAAKAGLWPEAEAMLLRARELDAASPDICINLAFLRNGQARFAEAEQFYRDALALDPAHALAHTSLAKLLLARGAFAEGWREQEWRWQWKEFPSPARNFAQPPWTGESLQGKAILLHAEQGFGDTIQCVRYVPMVEALGGRVVLEVQPELCRLMHSLAGSVTVVARGEPLPPFDVHCPLMSLPLRFETTSETIPRRIPYLLGDGKGTPWPTMAAHETERLRVGLVWAGNPGNLVDAQRSLPLAELEPLFLVPGVDFFSFQRGMDVPDDHVAATRFAGTLPETWDFARTAAALRTMDLVIAVDTAVAHLAGAQGVPVWIALPYVCDWRWMRGGSESAWYPSARLFRQTEDRRWESVVLRLRDALQLEVSTAYRSTDGN